MEESLKRLLKNSYSPYSGFRVAAICLMKDGKSFGGVNIENASYGATICAERVAIDTAIASGYTKGDFSRLYVMCDSEKISSCCFICRQVISEFFSTDSEVSNKHIIVNIMINSILSIFSMYDNIKAIIPRAISLLKFFSFFVT